MFNYGQNQFAWMTHTKRVSDWDIKKLTDILDQVYWLLEDNQDILRDADKPLKLDHKAAQELVHEVMHKLENDLVDMGLSKIDQAASDIEYAIKKIGSLKIDVNLTPENGMW